MTDLRYRQVAEGLRMRIAKGVYGPGGTLESEAELGRLFGVSRITVRKALELLRDEGIVRSRKGSGWSIAIDPVRQVLGTFPTVEASLRDDGVAFRRRVLEFGFLPAPPDVAAPLEIDPGAEVLRVRRLNFADDHAFDLVTTWVPGELGGPLSRSEVEDHGVFGSLRHHGVELVDIRQSITASLAGEEEAGLLEVVPGSPILVLDQVTTGAAGAPVKFSEHRYPAHRVHLEVRFPGAAATAEPPGLRLLGT
jgi:GntR family transcriptional regulator